MLNNLIIPLDEICNQDNKKIGLKAWSLGLIKSELGNVPTGYVFSSDFFHMFLQMGKILEPINELLKDKDNLTKKERIKLLIFNTEFSEHLKIGVLNTLKSLSSNIAIRSSFPFEDQKEFSGAGQFATYLNVRNELDEVISYVKKCWISFFESMIDLNVIDNINDLNLAVIIQDFFAFKKLGVSFSIHPVTGEEIILIESSTVANSVVEGGKSSITSYEIDKSTLEILGHRTSLESEMKACEIKILSQMTLKLESFFENGVDIEWGICAGGKIWLVQARSITTSIKKKNLLEETMTIRYIDIDDPIMPNLPLNKYYKGLIQQHWKKRKWMREEAKKFGVPLYNLGLLIFKKEAVHTEMYYEIVDYHDSDKLYIMFEANGSTYDMIIKKEELSMIIDTYYSKYVGEIIIWISEYYEPEYSGLATVLNDRILIEYVPGDIDGLVKPGAQFSTLIFDLEGNIIDKQLAAVTSYWALDMNKRKTYTLTLPLAQVFNLPDHIVTDAIELAKIMCKRFGNVRVEWVCVKNRARIYDLSVENQDLNLNNIVKSHSSDFRILSPGQASGSVILLTEGKLLEIKKLIKKRRSVVPSIAELEEFSKQEVIEMKKYILSTNSDCNPIIVSKYPDLNLCMFIPEAAGFIFEEGALLSHMGIILREAGIPAIIVPKATSLFKENQEVIINNRGAQEAVINN